MERKAKENNGPERTKEEEFPPRYSRRDIQDDNIDLEDYIRIYEDPYRGNQEYLPYRFRLAWLRNVYPDGIIRQLEPVMLADGRQLIGGMEFFRDPSDLIGERVYCQVSRDETGPELDTRDLFEVLRQKLINAITIGLGFSLPVLSTQEAEYRDTFPEESDRTRETLAEEVEKLKEELNSLKSQNDFLMQVKASQENEIKEKDGQIREFQQNMILLQESVGQYSGREPSHTISDHVAETESRKIPVKSEAKKENDHEYNPSMVSFVRKQGNGDLVWVNHEGGRITTPLLYSAEEAWNTEMQIKKGIKVPVRERLDEIGDSKEGKAMLQTWLDKDQKISSRVQFPAICAIRYLYYHEELNGLCRKLGIPEYKPQ